MTICVQLLVVAVAAFLKGSSGSVTPADISQMSGSLIRVVTVEDHPWVIKNLTCLDSNPSCPNSCYSGFLIDMLSKIEEDLKFNYTITEANITGTLDKNKTPPEWTGLLGSLAKNESDLALAALNITKERSDAFKFSKPFIDDKSRNLTLALAFPNGTKLEAGFSHLIFKLRNQRHIEQLTETWFNDGRDLWQKEKQLTKF